MTYDAAFEVVGGNLADLIKQESPLRVQGVGRSTRSSGRANAPEMGPIPETSKPRKQMLGGLMEVVIPLAVLEQVPDESDVAPVPRQSYRWLP
jgi:hypothetical protein